MPAEMPPNSYVRLYGVRYREAWRAAEVCVYLELARPRPCKDMPIQGCFAFIDWEPRFARAEFCLIADTPEHGLLPAAPIVLGGSIEEGMRAAMGNYMGLAAALGAPQIPTDA